jgi:hypothetical protein
MRTEDFEDGQFGEWFYNESLKAFRKKYRNLYISENLFLKQRHYINMEK